jgi:serine protease AprX
VIRYRAHALVLPLLVAAINLVALATPTWAGIGAQPPEPAIAPPPASPAIHLQAATFAPAAGETPDLPRHLTGEGPTLSASDATEQVLVQFSGPIQPTWRAALEATGARIEGYVPEYAYLVQRNGVSGETLRALEGVLWVGAYLPGYRLSPDVAALAAATADGAEADLLRVELQGETAALLASLPRLGVHLVAQEGDTLVVRADAEALASLARFLQVTWVERLSAPPAVHNDVATGQVGADRAWSLGYQGTGQIVNVADTGLDTGRDLPQVSGDMHADLDNRVRAISSRAVSALWAAMLENPLDVDDAADRDTGHGTHVAGSAVGNGARSGGLYRGVAPAAELTFQALERYCRWKPSVGWPAGYYLVGVPADLNELFAEAYAWGARVHNISWGTNDASSWGAYDASARQADAFVHAQRDTVIVVAAGNEGRDANRDGRVDPYSVVPPATAKNVIAVGATESYRPEQTRTYEEFMSGRFIAPIANDAMADAGIDGLMATGGRGPTLDGRLAPHLVAPGTWIASLRSSAAPSAQGWGTLGPDYMYFGGTSMSAPQVAGAAALVRQAYAARGHQPSAALVKATLLQTARDIPGQYGEAGPIPNADEGWGALDVAAAVDAAATHAFVDETRPLATGAVATHHYVVSDPAEPLRITLVWTDPPALPSVARQLVNDLDLEVVDPDGRVYRGNAFVGGWSAADGTADRTNNVEAVHIATPRAGVYTVRVRGFNVPLGPQDYALLANAPPQVAAPPAVMLRLPLVLRQASAPQPPRVPTPGPPPPPVPTHAPLPPTPVVTPTVAPGEFRDDFGTVSAMWPVTTTNTYSLAYTTDGAYAIRVLPAKHKVGALPGVTGSADMLLEVEARATGASAQAYGLLFNSGEGPTGSEEYHAFLVSPSGWWALLRSTADGDRLEIEWTESPAIATGTALNHLTVRREGTRIALAINGQVVHSAQGSAYSGGNRFGLLAASWGPDPGEARFDNVRMVPLGSGARLQSTPEESAPPERIIEGASGVAAPPS